MIIKNLFLLIIFQILDKFENKGINGFMNCEIVKKEF